MKKIWHCLLLVSIIAVACSKNTPNEVVPDQFSANVAETNVTTPINANPTGSISGKALPAGAIKSVAATSQTDGRIYRVNVDTKTGMFAFSDVADGKYTLAYTVNTYFNSLAKTEVNIAAGSSADAGMVTAKEKTFPLGCYVNGQYQGWGLNGYYFPKSGLFQLANLGMINVREYQVNAEMTYELSITISKFTGPGTYICDSSTANRISYDGSKNGLTFTQQHTGISGNTGTVIITELDQAAHTIKGTFTAKLAALGKAEAQDITSGIINATYKTD